MKYGQATAAMPAGSLFPLLLLLLKRNLRSPLFLSGEKNLPRPFSSGAFKIDESPSPSDSSVSDEDLKTRIFRLRFPKRSATTVLDRWVGEGKKITISELRQIAKDLRKSQRYNHALQISTWMEAQRSFQTSAADRADQLELIIKVHSLAEAEEYFENLLDRNSQKTACLPLLHSYVKERDTERAEAFMLKLQGLGLTVNPHLFNEMMKLYIATHQFGKVPYVIQQMKLNMIPRNVLSYNLWMSASGEVSGVASAEMVYEEMINDDNVEVGWSTLSTLANIYTKSGLVDKAVGALRVAERKLSTGNRLGYFFLITLYAALNNKDGVIRLWEASKTVAGRTTCANYMCILLCLMKLGDIGEAERVFGSWESECRKYDIRVSNVLLGAYMRKGWMDKAESLHLHTLEKGGCPNYKTWEILMEGWVKKKEMDKAIEAMDKGFARLKDCDWRPQPSVVTAIAEHFEEQGCVDDAKKYVDVLRGLNLVSLPVYKSLLRLHLRVQRPARGVLEMIERDKINLDEEALALVHSMSTNGVEVT
ncbi:pentatricopeptide repeat-containing protein At5g27460-like isoform X2 [Tasmannia lanceolata]|uniref:pentatricopeptide repeat-containing protein At5g27460-like isoform X2 n=1 Tax=Tasmannia lanceolata TaxID=3420 RepID=UPI0040644654